MNLKITAVLANGIAGDLPMLDAILEYEMATKNKLIFQKCDRRKPAPPIGQVPIPILRRKIGGRLVPCCSSPIISEVGSDSHEHFTKRLAAEHADLLHVDSRLIVATGNQVYKSYRLPLRRRVADKIAWFAVGDRRGVARALRDVKGLGKKRSYGNGVVAEWIVEEAPHDWSWFADSSSGPVLMRPLPFGDWLPDGLLGARRDFGACCPPYWHPDRYTENVVPC